MAHKTFRFHGGMQLDGHKQESLQRALQQASLPRQLIMPLKQHIGEYNKAVVEIGQRVLTGQLLASSAAPISAAIHAPTSGTISAIDHYPIAHPSGQADTCIVIDVDDKDE